MCSRKCFPLVLCVYIFQQFRFILRPFLFWGGRGGVSWPPGWEPWLYMLLCPSAGTVRNVSVLSLPLQRQLFSNASWRIYSTDLKLWQIIRHILLQKTEYLFRNIINFRNITVWIFPSKWGQGETELICRIGRHEKCIFLFWWRGSCSTLHRASHVRQKDGASESLGR